MQKVGIDKICFYTSHYYLDLGILANARGVDPEKFYTGLGQEKMSVPAPDEDIVTIAANAAKQAIADIDTSTIDTVLFATESSIDQSKAAGVYVKQLIGLHDNVRVVELKQACYSATAGLQMAAAMVARNPNKKVLLIASDVARYGLNTTGESSQGCGAVAMIVSSNPRILALDPEVGLYTDDVMDFWRPNYRDEALVEGHYSTKVYLHALDSAWHDYQANSERNFDDFEYVCYHNPVPRLVEKAHGSLARINKTRLSKDEIKQAMQPALHYGRNTGNSYSAALYVSLASLLDNVEADLSNKRLGFYSYGSGCVAEFFSGVVQPGYKEALSTQFHQVLLTNRQALTYKDYEAFYSFRLPQNGGECRTPKNITGDFRLSGIKEHKRQYEKVIRKIELGESEIDRQIKALSPGKLILSGEHAVVYGKPALAMAVDCYTETTVKSQQEANAVSLNLHEFDYEDSFTIKTLKDVKDKVKDKYKKFISGEHGIREVLQTPFELTQYTVSSLLDHLHEKMLSDDESNTGLLIQTKSTIPVGCGMGSSAASVLSMLKAVSDFYELDWNKDQYLSMAAEVEKLQHGKPSNLDLHISLHGGCIYFKNGQVEQRPVPALPLYIVNTGQPCVTTGECVAYVNKNFAETQVWETFSAVTNIMDRALQANDLAEVQSAVRDNHQLLTTIGVVPRKVQRFIKEVESLGAAAKVSGAGSIAGDNAGVVLVVADNPSQLESLCKRYSYSVTPVNAELRGLHAI